MIVERCQVLIDERREHPTDDLMSILVHAEIDGDRLSDWEIVMGFILLVTAGNDSTKATSCSGMKALMEHQASARSFSPIRPWFRTKRPRLTWTRKKALPTPRRHWKARATS